MKVKVLDGQSLFDIAIQHCGDVQASLAIAVANGLSVTDALLAGQELVVPGPADRDVQRYYRERALQPATAITTVDESQTIADEGVEFWTIEVDFIVS